jgi:hypothetical protein
MSGELSVHVFIPSSTNRMGRPHRIPLQALGRLSRTRGGLPDHAIRTSVALVRDNVVTSELFAALSKSAMYLQRSEFKAWYIRQKKRCQWPSQRTSKKPRTERKPLIGRPSRITDELCTSIKARVEEGSWSAAEGISKLEKLMVSHGAPKRDTLRRTVDRLYEETGDPRYRIIPRKRSKAKARTRPHT